MLYRILPNTSVAEYSNQSTVCLCTDDNFQCFYTYVERGIMLSRDYYRTVI